MEHNNDLFNYILSIGDNSLILGQRLGEWCGHGPILELDMALTNISLDLFGQTRTYFQYAAQVAGKGQTEDDIAFLRDCRDFKNVLLVEQPNEDFAYTIARQFFFDAYHQLFLQQLLHSSDTQLAAIAEKSLKEVKYHLRFSSEWLIRLGDGTTKSRQKMQDAVNDLWIYTSEFCIPSDLDKAMVAQGIGVDVAALKVPYFEKLEAVLTEATLVIPQGNWHQYGGKEGRHTEHLGHILAELQWMQRSYPKMEW